MWVQVQVQIISRRNRNIDRLLFVSAIGTADRYPNFFVSGNANGNLGSNANGNLGGNANRLFRGRAHRNVSGNFIGIDSGDSSVNVESLYEFCHRNKPGNS